MILGIYIEGTAKIHHIVERRLWQYCDNLYRKIHLLLLTHQYH